MSKVLTRLARWGAALALLFVALVPASARAQGTGRIVGTVTDSAGRAVANAQVSVVGTRFGAMSGADGSFRISGVPAGTYSVRVQRIGDRPNTIAGVTVAGGQEVTVAAKIAANPVMLGGVTSLASRRVEKITDAPATVTSLDANALSQSIGNLFAGALKEAKGVDFIQTGMTSVAINARGFNSSFNNRFLMVEDGRIMVLPENGLPVGQFTATPKVDLAGMEVLVGPGSALYGPDAANGVLSLRTKDPKQFPGATIEVVGGNRNYGDVQGRYAGVTKDGRFGYKASAEFQQARDWSNYLYYNASGSIVPSNTQGAVREDQLKDPVNWVAKVARGSMAGTWYQGVNRLEVSGGLSQTSGVGQTNVGRNQLTDWMYNTFQARWTTPHWYANAYRSQSKSGKSFALNRYAGAQLASANANKSPEELRLLSDWPSDGRMYAAEVQGNYSVPMLLNTNVIFGSQYRNDVVSSDRQWLWDRITKKDVSNDIIGYYAQTNTPLAWWLDMVLAGRVDKPKNYGQQWSPKAGLVFKPMDDQAFRVTFNRAYKTPTILQTSFFIPDWTSIVAIFGNTGGFKTVNSAGTTVATYNAVTPETNKTWEYGYKGILKEKLYVDATYYSSKYDAFLSPLSIIGNPYAGAAATYAVPLVNPGNNIPVNGQGRIVNEAGTTPIVLTYYNLGKATVDGFDFGANYYLTPDLEVKGNVSTVHLKTASVGGEATALNSPSTKWNAGFSRKNVWGGTFSASWRNVNSYYFRSGSNSGVIPTFGTLDVNFIAPLPVIPNATFNVSFNNLYTCSANNVVYSTPAVTAPAVASPNSVIAKENRNCGFGRSHAEMINMPSIGGMGFVGFRVQR